MRFKIGDKVTLRDCDGDVARRSITGIISKDMHLYSLDEVVELNNNHYVGSSTIYSEKNKYGRLEFYSPVYENMLTRDI